MKHAGVLSALLLTAALLCAMPSLCVWHESPSRAPDSLYPAQLRTLTVWLTPGDVGDRKLLSELCAAFEKQHKGVRIFLRIVSPEEYHAENAVLPDVALFETGTFSAVDRLIPLADLSAASGQYRGEQLAVPLWLSPNVLTFPKSWLGQTFTQEAADSSLLAAGTPAPEQASDGLIHADGLPWGYLLQNGAITPPEGVGWQQLMTICLLNERERLRNAVLHTQATVSPSVTASPPLSRPVSRGASPTPIPYTAGAARVEPLGAYQAKSKKGEPLAACALSPAVSDRVRYAALCQSSEEALAFLRFLLASQEEALAHGLIAPGCTVSSADMLTNALVQAFDEPVLPNAFAHTRQELLQLCQDGFLRGEDPVRTLLGLR